MQPSSGPRETRLTMAESSRRIGRGGAGNFYSPKHVEDASKAAAAEDPEAQTPIMTTNDLTRASASTAPPPEYQHTGRGGAGNWVKPDELESQGFSQEHDSISTATSPTPVSGTSFVLGASKPTYRGGRGGAGNYTDAETEERGKEKEESLRREMGLRAERDVEAGLARPPKTYGGVGGVWEMGDMK